MSLKISILGNEISDLQKKSLIKYLANPVSQKEISKSDTPAEEQILSILFGTKQSRHSALPSGRIREEFLRRIFFWKDNHLPIPIVIFWGALKGDNYLDSLGEADLSDFLAIKKLLFLQKQIQAVHSSGIKVTIITEDLAETVLHKELAVLDKKIKAYRASLQSLFSVLQVDHFISLSSESEIIKNKNLDPKDFLAKAIANGEIIYKYWRSSDLVLESNREIDILPEYVVLQDIGWKGTIPKELRQYYKNRVQNQYPNISDREVIEKASHYLGMCLARFQFNFFENEYKNYPAFRVAFNAYPSSVESSLKNGRIELKIDWSKSNKSRNPWNSFVLLEQKGSGFSYKIVTTQEFLETSNIPIQIVINNNEGDTISIDSGLIQKF